MRLPRINPKKIPKKPTIDAEHKNIDFIFL
jgi:hypothetical protein